MIKLAVVGLGKMGISHLAIARAHPDVDLAAICDSSGYALGVLNKYTGVTTFDDYDQMLEKAELDAVLIATPSSAHGSMVRKALDRGLHVFCEKPFTLDPAESDSLADLAANKQLVTQVGYHNRFVGAFQEVQRLLDLQAIGRVTHIQAEAYGPVVLKEQGSTWRTKRTEGGGCLYDYAAHAINLVNWYVGAPTSVGGTVLTPVFSRDTEDEVYSTLRFPNDVTAQLSVNWSDESYRKMTTRITIWGTAGRIFADRQECQVYLRDTVTPPAGYRTGWNVRYTTELTNEVWYYLRGEEYSAQLDHFVRSVENAPTEPINDFRSAAVTDQVMALMVADNATDGQTSAVSASTVAQPIRPKRRWFRRTRA